MVATTTTEQDQIMKQAIALARVSTSEQGKSGLGLAAQEAAIRSFANAEGFEVVEVVEEVASGKLGLADREGLRKALAKVEMPGNRVEARPPVA
jgi:DNA invertase Pin-like site-specific DNA recombinase